MIEYTTIRNKSGSIGTFKRDEDGQIEFSAERNNDLTRQLDDYITSINSVFAGTPNSEIKVDVLVALAQKIDSSVEVSALVAAAEPLNIEYSLYIDDAYSDNPTVLGLSYGDNDSGEFMMRHDGEWVELTPQEKEDIFDNSFIGENISVVEKYDRIGPNRPLSEYTD